MKQLDIDRDKDFHLLMVIEDFIRNQHKSSKWIFRTKPDGVNYWINSEIEEVSFEYPLLQELREKIDEFNKELQDFPSGNSFRKADRLMSYIAIHEPTLEKVLENFKFETFKVIIY